LHLFVSPKEDLAYEKETAPARKEARCGSKRNDNESINGWRDTKQKTEEEPFHLSFGFTI